jgi:sialidase-1
VKSIERDAMMKLLSILLFVCIPFVFLNFCKTPISCIAADFRTVVCPASENNPRNSEGDIIELKDGTLLLAWSKFAGRDDHANAVIAAKTSADGGKNWGEEFTLQESIGAQNVMSVSLLRLQSGTILFFFLTKNASDDLQLFLRSSTDEAKTWSEPRKISAIGGYHVMNNARSIQLASGRILAPIAWCADIGKTYDSQICFCYYSDDEGKTWHKAEGSVKLEDSAAMEPGLVELKNGTVLMIIRTRLDRIYRALSADQGETWSAAQAMDLIAPAAPATISRIPQTGDLLMVWNNNPLGNQAGWRGRTPLTAAVSADEGNTWTHVRNIEDDPDSGYAYTSIMWVNDRALLTYYHWKRGSENFQNTDLVLRSIPIRWFYE